MSINTVTDYLALPVENFVPDTRRPLLRSFDLDKNFGILTLHFSETVSVKRINVTGLCLQATSNWTKAA